ncbi:unnamed protein product [Schistosoma bovis]|nr:unnamed protein product [Schistosoma bovis]
MPELNMFTVRPADGGSRLVTRGLEDILPSTPQQSILTPPTEDEWDSDLIGCDEIPPNTHSITAFPTKCEATISDSFSYPLFIDVPSRASIDEGSSFEKMTTLSGLPSNSTASFGLSPILGSSDVTDVNIPREPAGHFDVSSHRTFADNNPYPHKSTLGTSLPSRGSMDPSSVTHLVTQRVGSSNSDNCFHKRWDTFSSQPELSSKGLIKTHDEDSPLEVKRTSIPSQTTSFRNQASTDYVIEAVLHWIESISPNTSESSTWEKVDINELKETMKTLLASSNTCEGDYAQEHSEDHPQPSVYSPTCFEQAHFSVIETSSETSMPSPSSSVCLCPKSSLALVNRETVVSNYQSTRFMITEPHQQQDGSQYCLPNPSSTCPKCFPNLGAQNSLEFVRDKISPCDCKSFQGDSNNANSFHLDPIFENTCVISPNFIHTSLDPKSDIFTSSEPSSNPLVYAQQILPSLINERGSVSFQLLSSILAHSRIECNQDCQRSMLLDGLKQAFSSIMYSPTSVPSTPTTNEVYYGADPVYSRSHSSMLHENKEQPNTGCTVPVRRHLSCVGFTDSLSPVSLIDSPTHNLSEAHNMFPRPSESGPYFSESCPSHINVDHPKELQTTSLSYPSGSAEMLHHVYFPPRSQKSKSGEFLRPETSHTVEQGYTIQLNTSTNEASMKTNVETNKTLKFQVNCNSFVSQPRKLDYRDSISGIPLRVGLPPSTTTSGRIDVRKCRKVYGIENRDQWCNQCKWKKACRRFPNPCSVSKHAQGLSNRNLPAEKCSRQPLESNVAEMCVICSPACSSDVTLPPMTSPSSWSISSSISGKLSDNSTVPYKNLTGQ